MSNIVYEEGYQAGLKDAHSQEKPFTEMMARQASALGLLVMSNEIHTLIAVCKLLGIDSEGTSSVLKDRIINNYAEGWE